MRSIVVSAAFVLATACTQGVNTVPEPVKPTDAIQYYDLDVPPDLDIKAVDFSATAFTEVSGMNGSTSSSTSGRGFIKVFAVQKKSGDQYLLLYEDVARRRKPIQVIRFKPNAEVSLPGSY